MRFGALRGLLVGTVRECKVVGRLSAGLGYRGKDAEEQRQVVGCSGGVAVGFARGQGRRGGTVRLCTIVGGLTAGFGARRGRRGGAVPGRMVLGCSGGGVGAARGRRRRE